MPASVAAFVNVDAEFYSISLDECHLSDSGELTVIAKEKLGGACTEHAYRTTRVTSLVQRRGCRVLPVAATGDRLALETADGG